MKKKTPDSELLKAVRELRVGLGDTQQSFAYRLGLAISTVVRYELTRPPSGNMLVRFAKLAREAGREDLAAVFAAAFGREIRPDRETAMMTSEWNDEKTVLSGYLFVSFEGPEQAKLVHEFYKSFVRRLKK